MCGWKVDKLCFGVGDSAVEWDRAVDEHLAKSIRAADPAACKCSAPAPDEPPESCAECRFYEHIECEYVESYPAQTVRVGMFRTQEVREKEVILQRTIKFCRRHPQYVCRVESDWCGEFERKGAVKEAKHG